MRNYYRKDDKMLLVGNTRGSKYAVFESKIGVEKKEKKLSKDYDSVITLMDDLSEIAKKHGYIKIN